MITKNIFNRYLAVALTCLFTSAAVWAAEPVVFWNGDFNVATKIGDDNGSYSLSLNDNELVGSGTGIKVTQSVAPSITLPSGFGKSMTIVMKYSSAAITTQSAILSFTDASGYELGAWASTTEIGGFYNKAGNYGKKTKTLPAEGYITLSYDTQATTGSCGVSGYVGTINADSGTITFDTNNGYGATNLRFTLPGRVLDGQSISLGGSSKTTSFPSLSNIVIEKVAIYNTYFTSSDVEAFVFPLPIPTAAKSVNFNTGDTTTAASEFFGGEAISFPTGGDWGDSAVYKSIRDSETEKAVVISSGTKPYKTENNILGTGAFSVLTVAKLGSTLETSPRVISQFGGNASAGAPGLALVAVGNVVKLVNHTSGNATVLASTESLNLKPSQFNVFLVTVSAENKAQLYVNGAAVLDAPADIANAPQRGGFQIGSVLGNANTISVGGASCVVGTGIEVDEFVIWHEDVGEWAKKIANNFPLWPQNFEIHITENTTLSAIKAQIPEGITDGSIMIDADVTIDVDTTFDDVNVTVGATSAHTVTITIPEAELQALEAGKPLEIAKRLFGENAVSSNVTYNVSGLPDGFELLSFGGAVTIVKTNTTPIFTPANETDWADSTLPVYARTIAAQGNKSFAGDTGYLQTLGDRQATVANVINAPQNSLIYALHAFGGENGLGNTNRDFYLMVSGGTPGVISGGEDAAWGGTKTVLQGNVLLNILGNTTVDYVYGEGLGGGSAVTNTGDVGIVIDENAQVLGSIVGGWQSRHNSVPALNGNISILVKNIQTHAADATITANSVNCIQGYIVGGGIFMTNGGRSSVNGNTLVEIRIPEGAEGEFMKHIVGGGHAEGGGDGNNVTGNSVVIISAPDSVIFSKNIMGGGHSTGTSKAKVGVNSSLTINGGTYTGHIYAAGDNGEHTLVTGTATLTINGGDLSAATLKGGTATGDKILNLNGGKIAFGSFSGFNKINVGPGFAFLFPDGQASGTANLLECEALTYNGNTTGKHTYSADVMVGQLARPGATIELDLDNKTVKYLVDESGALTRRSDAELDANGIEKTWMAPNSWSKNVGGVETPCNWVDGTEDVYIDADKVSKIVVDGVVNAGLIILRNSATEEGAEFRFETMESLETVGDMSITNPDYIIKGKVSAAEFAGKLYLQSRIEDSIALGPEARVIFVAGIDENKSDEENAAEVTTAYSYTFTNRVHPIGKVGLGTFIVPRSMYEYPFNIDNGAIRYDEEGEVTGAVTCSTAGVGKIAVKAGEGKAVKLSADNSAFTGSFVIESGTAKLGHNKALGAWGGTRTININSGATLDQNGVTNGASDAEAYHYVFEDGSFLVNNGPAYSDYKQILGSKITLNGNMTVSSDTVVGCSKQFNNATTLNLSSHTITKTGSGIFYLAKPTINGAGIIDVTEGALAFAKGYWDNTVNAPIVFSDGTIKIHNGAKLRLNNYQGGTSLRVKNFEMNGTEFHEAANSVVFVTGTLSGSGELIRLTLQDGATVDCAGEGAMSITDSVTFGDSVVIANAVMGDTVFTLADNASVLNYPNTVSVSGMEGSFSLVREGNNLILRPDSAVIKIVEIPEGYSISQVTVGDTVIEPTEEGVYHVGFGANVGIVYTAPDGSIKLQAILYAQTGDVVSAPIAIGTYSWGAEPYDTVLARPDATPTVVFAGGVNISAIADNLSLLSGKMKGGDITTPTAATFVKHSMAENTLKLQAQVTVASVTKTQDVVLTQVKCGEYHLVMATAATNENNCEVVSMTLSPVARVGTVDYFSLESAISDVQQAEVKEEIQMLTSISTAVNIPDGVTVSATYANRLTGALSGTGCYKMINTSDMTSSDGWNKTIGNWFGSGMLSSFNGTLWLARGRFEHTGAIESGRVKVKVTDGAQLYFTSNEWTNPVEISGNGIPFEPLHPEISAVAIRVDNGSTFGGAITAVVTGEGADKVIPAIGTNNSTEPVVSGDISAPNGIKLTSVLGAGVVSFTGTMTGKFEKIGAGEIKIKKAENADIKVSSGTLRLNESIFGGNVNFEVVSGAKLECYGWPTFNGNWSIDTEANLVDVFKNSGGNPVRVLSGNDSTVFTKKGSGTVSFASYFGDEPNANTARPYSGTISIEAGGIIMTREPNFSETAKVKLVGAASTFKTPAALAEGVVTSGNDQYIVTSSVREDGIEYSLIDAKARVEIPTVENAHVASILSGGVELEVDADGYVEAHVGKDLVVKYVADDGFYIKNGTITINVKADVENVIDVSKVIISTEAMDTIPVVLIERKGTKLWIKEGEISEEGFAKEGFSIKIHAELRSGYSNLELFVNGEKLELDSNGDVVVDANDPGVFIKTTCTKDNN